MNHDFAEFRKFLQDEKFSRPELIEFISEMKDVDLPRKVRNLYTQVIEQRLSSLKNEISKPFLMGVI